MITFTTRRLDGRSVIVEFEDLGLTVPARSEELRGVEVFTTAVRIDGEESFNQTPVRRLHYPNGVAGARWSEDVAFMENLGLDPEYFQDDLENALHQKVA
jgi:hypothetical protein